MSRTAYLLRPTGLKIFKVILNRHFSLLFNNIYELIHPLFYFIIGVVFFRMAIGSEQIPYKVGIGIMYTLNVFALILTSEALILKDYRLGFLEQFYLLGSDISWVITAKYFSHLLICIFISLITLPLFSLWLNIKSSDLLLIGLATILLDTVVLLSILFASCLLLGSKANILLSIIALIFILPALIFATLSIDNLGFLGLLVALFLFLGPIITIAVKHLIIIALEDRN